MSLQDFAANNIVIFDGAMGTSIQKVDISDEIWQGKNGCNEFLCLAAPDIIYNIHKAYFDAGANVAVTNTFGAISSVLAEYGFLFISSPPIKLTYHNSITKELISQSKSVPFEMIFIFFVKTKENLTQINE